MGLSCALYDQLELYAMRRQTVRLTFMSASNEVETIETKIKDLYVKEGEEYLLTENGQEYNLNSLQNIELLTAS